MEEDRSPIYFLGATSVLMFFTFFVPMTLRCLSMGVDGLQFVFLYALRRLTNSNEAPVQGKGGRAGGSSYGEWFHEKLDEIKKIARRAPRLAKDRLSLYWNFPSLFFWNDLPVVLNNILQPRYVLCAFWLLSWYFFMIQVPKARLLEILELNPHDTSITATEIKSAYKRLSFKYHPDHGRSEEHREKYDQVRKAYKRLKAAQKALETGGSEEDFLEDDGERGVNIPIPLFLRQYSSDHPGRTVFFLLIIAFGLPAFVLYRALFRPRGHKASARGTGIRSYSDYQRYIKQINSYKEQIDSLFMGLGNITEIPLEKGDVVEKTPRQVDVKKSPLDAQFPSVDDFQLPSMDGATPAETVSLKTPKSCDPDDLLVKEDPAIKVVFEATSPSYLSTVFAYIDIVLEVVIDKIVPIDIQSKNKRLAQLYDDKKALIKRINETVWNSKQPRLEIVSPILSKSDEPQAKRTENNSCATLRFLHRTQNRYKIEKIIEPLTLDQQVSTESSKETLDTPSAEPLGSTLPDARVGQAHASAFPDTAETKSASPFISTRHLDKLEQIDEEIAQLFADIEKSSFEYLSSHHIRGRKRHEKSRKMKKEKQAARS